MGQEELMRLMKVPGIPAWRLALARWVESGTVQSVVVGLILFNAVILGLETSPSLMASHGALLVALDKICLAFFMVELAVRWIAYGRHFWSSGWNIFDLAVISVALAPGAGPWAVLRSLRVLRVLRLLTVIPSLRRVIAAFIHSIPGLVGVVAVMAIFFYTAAVLATKLFGSDFPAWFGSIGASLFSLFQIMTLESWSMGIVRPVMEKYPYAWAFFVPFIMVATFTILNLFIGIIVSTMQELAIPAKPRVDESPAGILARIEEDLEKLKTALGAAGEAAPSAGPSSGGRPERAADH